MSKWRRIFTKYGSFYVGEEDEWFGPSSGVEEVALVERLSTENSRVLVVGAHVGTVAIPLAKSGHRVTAIEANPDTYQMLLVNIAENKCAMKTHNVAASDHDAPIRFVKNTRNSGGSKRMPKFHDECYFYDQPAIVNVWGVSLDDLLGLTPFELIFMDIEGSEYFAFLGMSGLLDRAKHLVVEFLPHHLSRVAGITVEQFVGPLMGFKTLYVPSRKVSVATESFSNVLQGMFDRGESDPAIVFAR